MMQFTKEHRDTWKWPQAQGIMGKREIQAVEQNVYIVAQIVKSQETPQRKSSGKSTPKLQDGKLQVLNLNV